MILGSVRKTIQRGRRKTKSIVVISGSFGIALKSLISEFSAGELPDQDDGEVMRLTTTPWQMYFDGSSTQGGAGAGIAFFLSFS